MTPLRYLIVCILLKKLKLNHFSNGFHDVEFFERFFVEILIENSSFLGNGRHSSVEKIDFSACAL